STGGGSVILKPTPVLLPLDVVTVTLKPPNVAFPATVNVAVIWVELTTLTLLTEISGLVVATVAPAMKFVPVSVTGTAAPATALLGLIEASVGAPTAIVKGTAELVP